MGVPDLNRHSKNSINLFYEKFLPLADRLYVTKIELNVEGDTYFPDYHQVADWQEIERQNFAADERNSHNFSTLIFDRVS